MALVNRKANLSRVRFDKETHTYYLDGLEIPSATSLIKNVIFPNQYDSVDKKTLDEAAEWGTDLHKAIETKVTLLLDEIQEERYKEFWKLLASEFIEIEHHEQIVYTNDYAGTYDFLGNMLGLKILGDLKTTSVLNEEYVSWQLSLYAKAYEALTNEKIDALVVVWLPKKGSGKLKYIKRKSDHEIAWLLEKWN